MHIIYGFGLLLLAILIWISVIDLREYRIPNGLNLILFISGIIWQLVSAPHSVGLFLVNSALLFAIFYGVRHFYKRLKGIEGLGLGDVKMAGASGIWFTPFGLPIFLFVASATGLLFALLSNGMSKKLRVPFGPFLAIGLFGTWLYERTGF